MPLQNRVNPEGEICFSPVRGTLMGNRGGCMHNDRRELAYAPKAKGAWITCLLEFKGRRRILMSPGQYTELFFLDEATALSAGHRPCAECRRERYKAFMHAWTAANRPGEKLKAGDLDAQLRIERDPAVRPRIDSIAGLPDGVIVKQLASSVCFLVRRQRLHRWAFEGYGPPQDAALVAGPFSVLTPVSTVKALANGYRADLHASAG